MSVEFPRPNLDEPDMWAQIAVVHQQWLRQVGPQMGIDVRQAVIGDALSSVVGDDANCFYPAAAGFHPEWAEGGKRHLLIRLGFEIDTPELPSGIRNRLQQVREQVESLDWTSEKDYNKARELWRKQAKNFVQREIALHGDLRGAVRYYDHEVSQKISGPWQEFLYGKKMY